MQSATINSNNDTVTKHKMKHDERFLFGQIGGGFAQYSVTTLHIAYRGGGDAFKNLWDIFASAV